MGKLPQPLSSRGICYTRRSISVAVVLELFYNQCAQKKFFLIYTKEKHMEEKDLIEKMETIEKKLDQIEEEVHKVRKHLMMRFIISTALFVLPIIALLFSIPLLLNFFESYPMNLYQELNWR